ncbi:MAG: type IV pilin-like G/H family protein [Alkalinema sp. FL-bin-369]|nr:type IV pilin-like G/H family protein [Leptolyngbyaceae cyanobacterium LF-bin-369]
MSEEQLSKKHDFIKKPSKSIVLIILRILFYGGIGAFLVLRVVPSFLYGANKARESEGKTITGSLAREQIAYHESNGHFSTDLEQLKVTQGGIYSYFYIIYASKDPNFSQQVAIPKGPRLKSYTSINRASLSGDKTKRDSILCESREARQYVPPVPIGDVACPPDFVLVNQ